VHPAVAVAIGNVSRRRARHEFGGSVKWTSRPRYEVAGLLTAGIRVDAALPNHLQRFAIQGEGHSDGVRSIRDIDDIIDDGHTVRVRDGADPPAVEVVASAVEDHDWRILALEDVEAILGIGRHRADDPKRLPRGELGKVLDEFVGIVACANLRHLTLPPRTSLVCDAV
jgi:hypothetical protein